MLNFFFDLRTAELIKAILSLACHSKRSYFKFIKENLVNNVVAQH